MNIFVFNSTIGLNIYIYFTLFISIKNVIFSKKHSIKNLVTILINVSFIYTEVLKVVTFFDQAMKDKVISAKIFCSKIYSVNIINNLFSHLSFSNNIIIIKRDNSALNREVFFFYLT